MSYRGSLNYIIGIHHRPKKDGTHPIKIRVWGPSTKDSSKRHETIISTKFPSCKKEHWVNDAQRYHRKFGNDHKDLNQMLDKLEEKCDSILRHLLLKKRGGTIEDFKLMVTDKHFGEERPPKTVRQKFIETMEIKQTTSKQGTVETYKDTLSSWEKFTDGHVYIQDLDYSIVRSFEVFLLGQGLATTSVRIRLSCLRAMYNDERKQGGIPANKDYPFDKVNWKVLKRTKKGHDDLDLGQFLAFMKIETTTPYEQLFKDIYIFSVLTNGINFRDLVYLTPSNIKNIYNEELQEDVKCLVYTRAKTGNDVMVELHPKALEIISKYPSDTQYLFPIHDGKERDEIKEAAYYKGRLKRYRLNIQKLASRETEGEKNPLVDVNLTPYTGRTTFANLAVRQGASISDIKDAMGHSTEKQTLEYLRRRNLLGGTKNLLRDIE